MPPKPQKAQNPKAKTNGKSADNQAVDKSAEKAAKPKATMAYPTPSAPDVNGFYVVIGHTNNLVAGPYAKKATAKTWRNAVNKYQEANGHPLCHVARAASHPLGASY